MCDRNGMVGDSQKMWQEMNGSRSLAKVLRGLFTGSSRKALAVGLYCNVATLKFKALRFRSSTKYFPRNLVPPCAFLILKPVEK